jgi:hypothetical protein
MQPDEEGQDALQGFVPMTTSLICTKAISDASPHHGEDSRTVRFYRASDGHADFTHAQLDRPNLASSLTTSRQCPVLLCPRSYKGWHISDDPQIVPTDDEPARAVDVLGRLAAVYRFSVDEQGAWFEDCIVASGTPDGTSEWRYEPAGTPRNALGRRLLVRHLGWSGPVSRETRRPVWAATARRAWSLRPV